jgi:hypothetical protein
MEVKMADMSYLLCTVADKCDNTKLTQWQGS